MKTTGGDMERPSFLVTVDVEGDDLWSRPRTVTTENARFLPRFQTLCERHGFRPTYLTTSEMAACPEFRAFAKMILRRRQAEIGMHLHAWSTPPDAPLTPHDHWYHPYLSQYPVEVMRLKIDYLTRLLEETFEQPIRSHRSGRWGFNETYARILAERGYWVDSSVTPHVSWRAKSEDPLEPEGPDYSAFPSVPYFLDLNDIRRPGSSRLLEVPVTTCKVLFDHRHANRGATPPYFVRWLRPNGRNLKALLWTASKALEEHRDCLVLMLHSSELMPGGGPSVPRAEDVEALYHNLEEFFGSISDSVRGLTLMEFYLERARQHPSPLETIARS